MAQWFEQDLVQEVLSSLQVSLARQLAVLTQRATPETVHNTRISIRRLRVALRAMKHELRSATRKRYLADLRQFSLDLERAREAVALGSAVERLLKHPLTIDRAPISSLVAKLAAERAQAHQELRGLIATAGWRLRIRQLERYSRERLTTDPCLASLLTIRDALARRQRRLRRALRHVGSTPRKLHRLRLKIKETRYLDEDFGPLLSMSQDEGLKRLRQLQDRLGEFRDNYRLKKWLRSQSDQSFARSLRHSLNARQERLRKVIEQLCRELREDPIAAEIAA